MNADNGTEYENPEEAAASLLSGFAERGLHLAVAESCTGGLVAALLTDVAGASEVFWGGVVAYSNESKMRFLGVDRKTLAAKGAVSPETARSMARGLLRSSQVDLAIAITGIAGPSGGSPEKPVGLVCFAWIGQREEQVEESRIFTGDRAAIRRAAAAHALRRALEIAIASHGVAGDETVVIDNPSGQVYSDR